MHHYPIHSRQKSLKKSLNSQRSTYRLWIPIYSHKLKIRQKSTFEKNRCPKLHKGSFGNLSRGVLTSLVPHVSNNKINCHTLLGIFLAFLGLFETIWRHSRSFEAIEVIWGHSRSFEAIEFIWDSQPELVGSPCRN